MTFSDLVKSGREAGAIEPKISVKLTHGDGSKQSLTIEGDADSLDDASISELVSLRGASESLTPPNGAQDKRKVSLKRGIPASEKAGMYVVGCMDAVSITADETVSA